MKKIQKMTLFANLLAAAIILSIVETYIPVIPVPGAKLGFANVVTIIVLVIFGFKDAMFLTLLRVSFAAILSGRLGPTFYMGLAGGILSTSFMALVYKTELFGLSGVSVIGSISHAIGQVLMGIFVIGTTAIIAYLPIMLFLSIPTGVLVGIIASTFLNKTKNWIKPNQSDKA